MSVTHSPRQGLTSIYATSHSPRQSVTSLIGHSPRQSITDVATLIHSPRQSITPIYSAEFAAVYYQPSASTWLGTGTELLSPTIAMTLSGVDIRPYLKKFTLTRPFNGKMQLKCTFAKSYTNNVHDEVNDLSLPGYGAFSGLLRAYDTGGARYLNMSITVASQTWTSPTLFPLEPSDTGTEIEWVFEDFTRLLQDSTHSFTDIVYDLGDRKQAVATTTEECAVTGFTSVALYPDYTISRQNRGPATSLLSSMDEKAKVMQAGRRVIGNVLTYKQAALGPAQWTFTNRLNIKSLRKYEKPRGKNQWKFARVEQIAGVIGRLTGDKPGFNTINFSPASKQVSIEIVTSGCDLSIWQYFNKAGVLLNPGISPNYYNSDQDIASAKFTATPGRPGVAISFTLTARGAPRVSMGATTTTRNISALQSIYGVNPERSTIQSSLILDGTTLGLSADAYANEASRNAYGLDIATVHANPFIEPGDTISCTDILTRQSAELWFVDVHVFDWQPDAWETRLDCSHGL